MESLMASYRVDLILGLIVSALVIGVYLFIFPRLDSDGRVDGAVFIAFLTLGVVATLIKLGILS